jgi:hypothetical protein
MFRLDAPAKPKTISSILSIDYQTTLKYLDELSYLGLITHTTHGYILTHGGSQLILPATPEKNESEDQKYLDHNSDILININPDTQFQFNSKTQTTNNTKTENTQTNIQTNTGETIKPDEHYLANMECLSRFGISKSKASMSIAYDPVINPDYIELQARRLFKEDRFTTGLLITVLRCHDPLPYSFNDEENKPNKYISGKYSSSINLD